MKKILITGVSGFAGSFLAEELVKNPENKVVGIAHGNPQNLLHIQEKIQIVPLNLLDAQGTIDLVQKVKPDEIYHLAALTSPAKSFENPSETMTNNITAEVNVLEAVKQASLLNTKILITASSEVYGAPKELPMNELTPLRPVSPYAVSKIAQDYLGLQYFLAHKVQAVRVRPFNHIGPRQTANFVVGRFAQKIVEIEKASLPAGRKETPAILTVGNLDAKRDFTDVRDMVKAYTLIVEKGAPGDVYNIGSGKSYTIKQVLDMLLSLSTVKITVQQDPALLRPADIPEIIADPAKMQQITGWKPEISIEQTLKDTLDYWRNIS